MNSKQQYPGARELQRIEDCWKAMNDAADPLVTETWPREKGLTALEAMDRWAPAERDQLEMKLTLIRRFGVVPVVAVVGLINSGKSSLVASFLSPDSRSRVLRGMTGNEGSQRFTLWIPAAWRNDEGFYERLLELLGRLFGEAPEALADSAEEAREQQNNLEALGRPLLAVDSNLEKHGIALLDCPDIQRGKEDRVGNETRLGMVSRAAELCAAVLVLSSRNQIEIRDLHEIMDRMPDAQRIYAINLIREEPAHEVVSEVRQVLKLTDETPVYGAYDFLIPTYAEYSPLWDENLMRDRDERLLASSPCFFELMSDSGANLPSSVEANRSLQSLAQRVTPEAMQQKRLRELQVDFFSVFREALKKVETEVAALGAERERAEDRLLEECRELIQEDGESLRITINPDMVSSIEESLNRTAPTHYRIMLIPSRMFFQAVQKAVEAGRRGLAGVAGEKLKEKKEALEKKWKFGGSGAVKEVGTRELDRMLSLWSGAAGAYKPPELWQSASQSILERFREEDRTNLSDQEWDEITGPLWSEIPFKARLKIFSSAFLLLGSLLLAFFDGAITFTAIHIGDLLGGLGL
ncbi:MAG: hypothetical protein AAF514_21125, partial [Verrucomicrobiota bacterium]